MADVQAEVAKLKMMVEKMMVEKTEALTEKTKLEEQMEKMRMFVAELQGAVECPVCLVVPREGPVPCCPAGHITCSPCLERWRGEALWAKRGVLGLDPKN